MLGTSLSRDFYGLALDHAYTFAFRGLIFNTCYYLPRLDHSKMANARWKGGISLQVAKEKAAMVRNSTVSGTFGCVPRGLGLKGASGGPY